MKKCKIIVCIVTGIAVLLFSLGYARMQLKASLHTFAETKGNAMLSLAFQNELCGYLQDKGGEYLTIHYDANDGITAISIHSDKITLLASEMTVLLLELLNVYQNDSFGIPLGNLTGSILLSGKGPMIPLQPLCAGNIANQMCSTLQSAGINQTLHKVFVRFCVTIEYLAPVESYTDTITFDVTLAETLIVGDVPIYRD